MDPLDQLLAAQKAAEVAKLDAYHAKQRAAAQKRYDEQAAFIYGWLETQAGWDLLQPYARENRTTDNLTIYIDADALKLTQISLQYDHRSGDRGMPYVYLSAGHSGTSNDGKGFTSYNDSLAAAIALARTNFLKGEDARAEQTAAQAAKAAATAQYAAEREATNATHAAACAIEDAARAAARAEYHTALAAWVQGKAAAYRANLPKVQALADQLAAVPYTIATVEIGIMADDNGNMTVATAERHTLGVTANDYWRELDCIGLEITEKRYAYVAAQHAPKTYLPSNHAAQFSRRSRPHFGDEYPQIWLGPNTTDIELTAYVAELNLVPDPLAPCPPDGLDYDARYNEERAAKRAYLKAIGKLEDEEGDDVPF